MGRDRLGPREKFKPGEELPVDHVQVAILERFLAEKMRRERAQLNDGSGKDKEDKDKKAKKGKK